MQIKAINNLNLFKPNFCKKTDKPVCNLYSDSDSFEYSTPECEAIHKKIKNKTATTEDIQNLTLSRVNTIVAKVKNFITQHPEFSDKEADITQDLMLSASQSAVNYSQNPATKYYLQCSQNENRYFKNLLNPKDSIDFEPLEALKDEPVPDRMEDNVEAKEGYSEVAKHFKKLTSQEQKSIIYRYGLNGEGPMTYDKVKERIGTNKSRAAQLTDKGLNKLRNFLADSKEFFNF